MKVLAEKGKRYNSAIEIPNLGDGGDAVTCLCNYNGSQDVCDHMLSGKQGGEKYQKGHEKGGGLVWAGNGLLSAYT